MGTKTILVLAIAGTAFYFYDKHKKAERAKLNTSTEDGAEHSNCAGCAGMSNASGDCGCGAVNCQGSCEECCKNVKRFGTKRQTSWS